MNKFYTEKHLTWLAVGYRLWSARDLTREFNKRFGAAKTEEQIRSTLNKRGIICGRAHRDRFINRLRIFTGEQVQFLRDNYTGRSIRDMTLVFNGRFGTGFTERQIRTAVHNRGIVSGRTGWFPPGNQPWNKGTKGLMKRNRTTFQKGNVPANRKPLGHEWVDDGYIQIKIAERDPYTGYPTRYKPKHVYVWEQARGPVPEGMVVIFRDGDQAKCELENLMLVSRAELLALNQHGYKEALEAVKPSILALARLKVKMWGKRQEYE